MRHPSSLCSPRPRKPSRHLLTGLVLGVEVVIAGTDQHPGFRPQAAEIFSHDHALDAAIDDRGEIEVVAGQYDHVEVVSLTEDPVELGQRIMEVGYQE